MDKRVEAGKPLTVQPSMTLAQMRERFATEDACKAFIRDSRWPDGVVKCPRCGNRRVYELKARPWHWQCESCKEGRSYRFSVLKGTIFENTKYPLRTWFEIGYLMCQSKKGISALQIHRQIGSGDYRTAWYICQRLRAAMQNETFRQLVGEVEVDETLIGGKEKNKHYWKKDHETWKRGKRGSAGKTTVIGAISRKGSVVAKMIDEAGFDTFDKFVHEAVSDKVSLVATDENPGYRHLKKEGYPHQTVNHARYEYVRGNIHTNTIEGFWSLLKRGIMGNYHKVSRKYLPLYVNEFAFRYNNRKNPDIFEQLLSSV